MSKKKKEEETPEVLPESETEAEILDFVPPPDKKLAEMEDKYIRTLAEFDNFRKRTAKEMLERRDETIRSTIEKLLPITDNFERALAAAENKEDSLFKGIEMIARQFDNALEEIGVKLIETTPGTVFDANLHYAVAVSTDETLEPNTIAETMQKGYILKERVIRPAMVKVTK